MLIRFRSLAAKPENLANLWWAREDSNLQPSGYERATLPGKISDYWHFRAGSLRNVRVWLRRIIGYLLVGCVCSEFECHALADAGHPGSRRGPHLHYETRVDGEAVDPQKFLKAGATLFGI